MGLSWELVWLCLAALAAGAVNSIAGGGTLLTFPALLAGLFYLGAADAAVVANATSTVALVPGSLAGAWGYRREMKRVRRWLSLLVGPSLAGGVIGILLGISIPLSVRFLTDDIRVPISPMSVVVAFGVSVAVGVVFGMLPASRLPRGLPPSPRPNSRDCDR